MDEPHPAKDAEFEAAHDTATAEPPAPTRRSTMTEVALAAGVSQTTVSLVLNEAKGARLSADTRRRVLEAARKLDYTVVRRRGGASDNGVTPGMIGFIVDEMSTDPWMALALDGAREKAWEHGITIAAAATRGDADIEQAVLRQMQGQKLIGLIYGTINTRRVEPPPFPGGIPTVLLNCYLADRSLPSVVPAEVVGGHTATARLAAAGHRRIGFINGEAGMEASRDRLKGYRQALATADLHFDADLVRSGNWEPSAGYEQTRALMALASAPTAIFCGNDLMAMGCYEALKEMGFSIPRDVAVIGYDDREIAQYMHPPLTTVVLPHTEMGAVAAEYLIDQAARPMRRPTQIKVEGQLVERQSV
ncbi:MAG: LacI family transcriptional regulator [Hyphomicrobiales bacterium]|nr:LacI family transcriptional regulator [Hyphomicrobiales bacterium]